MKIDIKIKQNSKAVIKYNVNNIIEGSYDCSSDELKNSIQELIKNIRLANNKDKVIEKAHQRLNEYL